ncbi:hypothetical protein EYM_02370 [Ignicoccus islandicus DSM 13165]|uniref:Uncharacterized protein n=1 Tax=Ignicoccus islandicus DSM 13165 TaxID=940295 RepID=A0A0U3EAH2_9CREN|nr:hypothetical protein [Ignicoccus islandicus]ALU12318.1 hypothetical protein EYM_02370 [Ignicoccus islandicus DSM 13165]
MTMSGKLIEGRKTVTQKVVSIMFIIIGIIFLYLTLACWMGGAIFACRTLVGLLGLGVSSLFIVYAISLYSYRLPPSPEELEREYRDELKKVSEMIEEELKKKFIKED